MIIDLFKKINLHHTIYWRDIKFKTTSSMEHQGWIGAGFTRKVSPPSRAGGPVVVAGVVWCGGIVVYYTVYSIHRLSEQLLGAGRFL